MFTPEGYMQSPKDDSKINDGKEIFSQLTNPEENILKTQMPRPAALREQSPSHHLGYHKSVISLTRMLNKTSEYRAHTYWIKHTTIKRKHKKQVKAGIMRRQLWKQ